MPYECSYIKAMKKLISKYQMNIFYQESYE